MMDWKLNNKLIVDMVTIMSYMGNKLTDEQREFISDFTVDTLSFSDAGTGKTYSLIAGIALAQMHYKIKGSQICCISYTNAAVSEIAGRYDKIYKSMPLGSKPDFRTFHSLNYQILREAYPGMKVVNQSFIDVKPLIEDYMKEVGLSTTDGRFTRKLYNAINSCNSALVFSTESLKKNFKFVSLGIEVDQFNHVRRKLFRAGIITKAINQGDIPIYCLYALHKYPKVTEAWRGKFRIMVVDEFQDLTLLHLEILNYITQTLIAIGDMKQQIYGFNGASDLIVDKYLEHRPNARICQLTQSFRCTNEIAEFAKGIVERNVIDGKPISFRGVRDGGIVEIMKRDEMDWAGIANSISTDIKRNSYVGARDVMFLYRNNASMIPIVEELYKLNIPFRCSSNKGYTPIMDIPIVGDLFTLARIALDDENIDALQKGLLMFPEFKDWKGGYVPPVQAVKKYGKGLLSLNYRFQEDSSRAIMSCIIAAKEAIENGESAGRVLNKVYPGYRTWIIRDRLWMFDNEPAFYFDLVGNILSLKTIDKVIYDEERKLALNDSNISSGVGIRCYTLHSAKGLEADDVYILDANEGLFPNIKVLEDKTNADCILDAAKDIRNERNLLFVGCTRAKRKLTITYSNELTSLLTKGKNKYKMYDDEYKKSSRDVKDNNVERFYELFGIGDNEDDRQDRAV